MARLASGLWVAAYLARLGQAAIPAYVTARGDPGAGAAIVRIATLDGRAQALQRTTGPASGARRRTTLAEGTEAEDDAVLARARARDPDLWLIEIEDRAGRTLLDEPGLDA